MSIRCCARRADERRGTSRGCAGGEPGSVIYVDREWWGWSGLLAHPDSPAGGGGPGHFRAAGPVQGHEGGDVRAWRVDQGTPLDTGPGTRPPAPAKLAPATTPRALGTLKTAQSDLLDVLVDAELLGDGKGSKAETTFKPGKGWSAPGYSMSSKRVIEKFKGKFTWRATITLQTVYASPGDPDQVSCYGRGTTEEDVRNGNITLGFHESCHRDDFTTFLLSRSLPEPPSLATGMAEADYKARIASFDAALKAYFDEMQKLSEARTDEVGHPKSTWEKTGTCFRHIAPRAPTTK